jgi:hypothetical protein
MNLPYSVTSHVSRQRRSFQLENCGYDTVLRAQGYKIVRVAVTDEYRTMVE